MRNTQMSFCSSCPYALVTAATEPGSGQSNPFLSGRTLAGEQRGLFGNLRLSLWIAGLASWAPLAAYQLRLSSYWCLHGAESRFWWFLKLTWQHFCLLWVRRQVRWVFPWSASWSVQVYRLEHQLAFGLFTNVLTAVWRELEVWHLYNFWSLSFLRFTFEFPPS